MDALYCNPAARSQPSGERLPSTGTSSGSGTRPGTDRCPTGVIYKQVPAISKFNAPNRQDIAKSELKHQSDSVMVIFSGLFSVNFPGNFPWA